MAADEGQQAIGGFSRRSVLRGGLLAGAGVATVGAMSAVLTGTAKAATPDPQPGWGYCRYCATMWWTAGESGSHCPGSDTPDGLHHVSSGSYDYRQYNGASSGSSPQVNWRWCSACQGMFWGTGVCYGNTRPGDYYGPHTAGTTNYNLYFNGGGLNSTTDPQAYWRWCGLCSLLYWQGSSGSTAGACAANSTSTSGPGYPPFGPHNAGSSTVYDMYWIGTY
jgi:hypothetical protein